MVQVNHSNTSQDSDQELVELVREGDLAAFSRLVAKHHQVVFTLAQRLLAPSDDPSDVVQDVFVRVLQHIGRFRGESSFTTWLTRIIVNRCRTYQRWRLLQRKARETLAEIHRRNTQPVARAEQLAIELRSVASQLPFILGARDTEFLQAAESDQERELAQRLLTHAREGYETAVELERSGMISQNSVFLWSKRILEAEERLYGPSIQSAEQHRNRIATLLAGIRARFEEGTKSAMDLTAAQYAAVEAELLAVERR